MSSSSFLLNYFFRTKKNLISSSEDSKEVAESDPKNIIISTQLDLERIRKRSKKTFYIGVENIANDFTAIATRKGSPLLPKLNFM